jgi:hypothetical protein
MFNKPEVLHFHKLEQ